MYHAWMICGWVNAQQRLFANQGCSAMKARAVLTTERRPIDGSDKDAINPESIAD
jgi:hypothetical protein